MSKDIIDKEGRKEVYIGYTVEIEVYVKLRLMSSDHLACYFVILLPSLEYYVRIAAVLSFAYTYAYAYIYAYDSPYVNCQNSNPRLSNLKSNISSTPW